MSEHRDEHCTEVPDNWPTVPAEAHDVAKERALQTLVEAGERGAAERLAAFYDTESDYAGASFVDVAPNEWLDVTVADLHATSLLSVDVGPQATRRLTSPGAYRRRVLRGLRALPDRDLAVADAATLLAMEEFYRAAKAAMSSASAKNPNPWVTTSKLCARKRPELFPVRDNNVCGYLGILKLDDFRADWLVFRALVQDDEVRAAIDALPQLVRAAGNGRLLALDTSRLRLLDAALWTHTIWHR